MRIRFIGGATLNQCFFIKKSFLNFRLLDAFVKQVLRDVSVDVIATFVLVMVIVVVLFTILKNEE